MRRHRGWLIAIVGTESLVLLGAPLARRFGSPEDTIFVAVYALQPRKEAGAAAVVASEAGAWRERAWPVSPAPALIASSSAATATP